MVVTMGEAKRRAEAGAPTMRWKCLKTEMPPDNHPRLVVLAIITCPCAAGAQIPLNAARVEGEWVIAPFEHIFEIEYWLELPEYPKPTARIH